MVVATYSPAPQHLGPPAKGRFRPKLDVDPAWFLLIAANIGRCSAAINRTRLVVVAPPLAEQMVLASPPDDRPQPVVGKRVSEWQVLPFVRRRCSRSGGKDGNSLAGSGPVPRRMYSRKR